MSWQNLESVDGISRIVEASHQKPQLIFKHSTRCGVSAGAKRRLDEGTSQLAQHFDLHFLDLISYRDVSNEIESRFSVRHESPQVLLINGGTSVYDSSHSSIEPESILARLGE